MKQKLTIIIAFVLLLSANFVNAQEYKHAMKSATQLSIANLTGGIIIESTSGSELIIEVSKFESKPEKAEGLKSLYASGATDNTTIGLQVKENGNTIEISGASKQSEEAYYTFKIPKGINLKIDYNLPMTEDAIKIKDFSAELDIKTMNEDINLANVTGPMVLYSTNGDIGVDFATVNQNSPISITAINGEIEIKLPTNTPANLKLGTINGEIFTNFDIAFDKPKGKEGLSYIGGGSNMDGKINNGGVEITLKTINDNIYLRKK